MPGHHYNSSDLAGPKMLGVTVCATAHFFLLIKAENQKNWQIKQT